MKAFKKFFLCLISLTSCIAIGLREASIWDDHRQLCKVSDDLAKMVEHNRILLKWLNAKQNDKNIATFFLDNGFKSIAIYGMKDLGEALFKELSRSEIEVKYGIDKNTVISVPGLKIYAPDDILDEVDAIVVTPIHYFAEIAGILNSKFNCPIISIEDIFSGNDHS